LVKLNKIELKNFRSKEPVKKTRNCPKDFLEDADTYIGRLSFSRKRHDWSDPDLAKPMGLERNFKKAGLPV